MRNLLNLSLSFQLALMKGVSVLKYLVFSVIMPKFVWKEPRLEGARPRLEGARLRLSCRCRLTPKRKEKIAVEKQCDSSVWCCFLTGFLNLWVHVKNKQPTLALSLNGNRGNTWQQAHVPINPAGPFQVSRHRVPRRHTPPHVGCLACASKAHGKLAPRLIYSLFREVKRPESKGVYRLFPS